MTHPVDLFTQAAEVRRRRLADAYPYDLFDESKPSYQMRELERADAAARLLMCGLRRLEHMPVEAIADATLFDDGTWNGWVDDPKLPDPWSRPSEFFDKYRED